MLNGASLAFLTSIFGLVSSIIFSVGEKRWIHRFDLALGCWVSGLDRCMTRVVPEQIASEQLREVRQQTEIIGGFTNQLAFQIAEALEQRMTKSVAPVLETLVEEIKGLRSDRQGTNEAAMEHMVGRFTKQLEGAAGTEMQALGVTLGQLTQSLTEQQESAINGLTSILGDLRHMVTDTRSVLATVSTLTSGLDEATERLRRLADPIAIAAERFEQTGGKLETSVEKIDDGVHAMSDSMTLLVHAEGRMEQSWSDYQRRFEGIDESLGHAFTQLDEGIQRYSTQVSEFIAGLDRHTGDIVGKLGGAASDISEAIDELGEQTELQVGKLASTVDLLSTVLGDVRDILRKSRGA